jgi:putative NADH-flavin reductase
MLDPDGDRTGNYRTATAHSLDTAAARTLDTATETPLFRYADLAVALIDEATAPRHHRTLLAVGY